MLIIKYVNLIAACLIFIFFNFELIDAAFITIAVWFVAIIVIGVYSTIVHIKKDEMERKLKKAFEDCNAEIKKYEEIVAKQKSESSQKGDTKTSRKRKGA